MSWPTFVVLGAPRAGTTALWAALYQHPEIAMSRIKEPNFFAYGELDRLDFRGPAAAVMAARVVLRVDDYGALFPPLTPAGKTPLAIGEASMTNFLPRACARIYHYVPQAKLIAILRHPAERAYSQFINARRMGWEPLADFTAALAAEPERLRQHWIPYLCYTYRGYYGARLAPYFAAFPHEQIRLYRYEDWHQRPQWLLQDLFAFLGVDASFVPRVPTDLNAGQLLRYRWGGRVARRAARSGRWLKHLLPLPWQSSLLQRLTQQHPPPPLPPELRQQLTNLHRADLLALQALLHQNVSKEVFIEWDISDWLVE